MELIYLPVLLERRTISKINSVTQHTILIYLRNNSFVKSSEMELIFCTRLLDEISTFSRCNYLSASGNVVWAYVIHL